jgi:signal peptidase I
MSDININEILSKKEEEQKSRLKKIILEFYDIISFFVFALGLILFIKYFIFTPFTVVGQSMEPTIHNGDFLIVDEITPRIKDNFKR